MAKKADIIRLQNQIDNLTVTIRDLKSRHAEEIAELKKAHEDELAEATRRAAPASVGWVEDRLNGIYHSIMEELNERVNEITGDISYFRDQVFPNPDDE